MAGVQLVISDAHTGLKGAIAAVMTRCGWGPLRGDLQRQQEAARLLELICPAGFEHYFRELAPLLVAAERDQAAIGVVGSIPQSTWLYVSPGSVAERNHSSRRRQLR